MTFICINVLLYQPARTLFTFTINSIESQRSCLALNCISVNVSSGVYFRVTIRHQCPLSCLSDLLLITLSKHAQVHPSQLSSLVTSSLWYRFAHNCGNTPYVTNTALWYLIVCTKDSCITQEPLYYCMLSLQVKVPIICISALVSLLS